MNKLLTLLSLWIIALGVMAQEKAQIKVGYDDVHQNWNGRMVTEKMLLLANSEKSHYYCPRSLLVDSMLSTPEGTVKFNSMVEAANAAGERPALLPGPRTYVIKMFGEGKISHYNESAGELGHYDEKMDEQNWEISDSTKVILGYECILAETDYHGRHWKAWFAPEIPIPDGPWKLCGLPGLILSADADNGKYHFEATGIETTDQPFPAKMYGHELSVPARRKDMLKTKWAFYTEPTIEEDGSVSPPWPLAEGYDLIETDYK